MTPSPAIPPGDSVNQTDAPWRGLLATAAQFGAYAWVEAQVSSMLGEWATTQTDAEYKVDLFAQSALHRWHSELFFARLPVLSVVVPEDLVRSPNPQFESFLGLVRSAASRSDQLVALRLVLLPYLLNAYQQELLTVSEVADPSARRTLGLVVADLQQQLLQPCDGLEMGSDMQLELVQALEASPGLVLLPSSGDR